MCLGIWGVLDYSALAQDAVLHQPSSGEGLNSVELVVLLRDADGGQNSAVISSGSKLAKQPLGSCQCKQQNPEKQKPAGGPLILVNGHDIRPRSAEEDVEQDGELEQTDELDQHPPQTGEAEGSIDDELGILRVRSHPLGIDSELGLLRIRPTDEVPLDVEPEATRQASVFLTGRANVYGGGNLFRTPNPIDDRIYQAGVGVFAFPSLSEDTRLVLSAETNLARYEDLSVVDYNELQFQAGIRQRLGQRSYGQINWRYQDLSTPGSDSFFTANYVELLLSRRDILNNRTWLDTYYQARVSSSDPKEFSRFSQIATSSLNYGFDPQTRVSLLYQLFLDDYTEIVRFDTYHQILVQASHDLSSTTRISLFTGVRFGSSSLSAINFDDTIYGASINVNWPLF
ncbi:hypothetical protein [Leptothoe sp. PORK10 BA2]|uniref:hypothetical protein n=1 Tax=Leptothoe sp. PORK10 BA2 TaxID=3110254 RepID=UPI002B1FFFF1|nr:hypothetical protein [Leptothoe sp. PORK10 BA2]MEA5463057.1 hypothetical protein [Leptothoe sp. PORK10 BA2]